MADVISFKKWNSNPYSTLGTKELETKYYQLGSSSNKAVIMKFSINLIASAASSGTVLVWYRTNTQSDYTYYGDGEIAYSASANGTEVVISSYLTAPISDAPGVQFKIFIQGTNDVSINDYHFMYRLKRNYSVEDSNS